MTYVKFDRANSTLHDDAVAHATCIRENANGVIYMCRMEFDIANITTPLQSMIRFIYERCGVGVATTSMSCAYTMSLVSVVSIRCAKFAQP